MTDPFGYIRNQRKGDLAYFDGIAWRVLHPSTSGYALTTNGTGTAPTWTSIGISDPLVIGAIEASDYLAVGASPASTGLIRLPGDEYIKARGSISYDAPLIGWALTGGFVDLDPDDNGVRLTDLYIKAGGNIWGIKTDLSTAGILNHDDSNIVVQSGWAWDFETASIRAPSLPAADPGNFGLWVNAANHNAVTIGSGA